MYYKKYGNLDLEVSAIGLGLMRFDADDIANNRLEKCAEIPLYALEKGINYWDTSPTYCEDKSETITGLAIKQSKRSDIILASKTNINLLGGGTPSRDDFRRRLEGSLTKLNTDYLDFYHMWCILSIDSLEEHIEKLYGFYEEAKKEGLIRNIVFSSHMPGEELRDAVEYNQFAGLQIGYNALNYRFRQTGIARAYEKGLGVVVMNPLSGGMIPATPEKFQYLIEGTDFTVPQAALRFVASHKEITVTLAGCGTKAHIDDAVKAVENLEEVSAKDVMTKYENQGVVYNDLCTSCGYCKGCPVDIEIPKYMDVYNNYMMLGDKEETYGRMKGMWFMGTDSIDKCLECGKCERQCTQHLPIIQRLKEVRSLF